jgi:Ca2+-binding EF-hand superfamily protein
MNAATDKHIDRLELLVCERIRTLTGYATDHINVRTLIHQLKYSDKTDCGLISLYHFNEFLLRMNIVGIRDSDMLFNRYDEDFKGFIDYRDFAHIIFGAGPWKRLTGIALDHFHILRQYVIQKNSFAFLLRFVQVLTNTPSAPASAGSGLSLSFDRDRDRDGFVSIPALLSALTTLLPPTGQGSVSRNRIGGINRTDLQSLLQNHFDVHGNGKVNLPVFLKRFKVSEILFSLLFIECTHFSLSLSLSLSLSVIIVWHES